MSLTERNSPKTYGHRVKGIPAYDAGCPRAWGIAIITVCKQYRVGKIMSGKMTLTSQSLYDDTVSSHNQSLSSPDSIPTANQSLSSPDSIQPQTHQVHKLNNSLLRPLQATQASRFNLHSEKATSSYPNTSKTHRLLHTGFTGRNRFLTRPFHVTQ